MRELIKQLCLLDGPSGNENSVSDFIIEQLKDYCEIKKDGMGNLIAFKKGKKRAVNKLMLDAHTDEVGMIITSYTSDGFLKFKTIGGIQPAALLSKKVRINGQTVGIIGTKPVHLCKGTEKETPPSADSLYIDIGATSREEAEKAVPLGSFATYISDFSPLSDNVFKAKAIDDRAGCAILISLLKKEAEFDYYATFTVQEELGCRGARVAAYSVEPDFCICLEATTAADIDGVSEENTVCKLGNGPAVSFMDRSTLYDRELYSLAINSGIPCQSKASVTGGNNSGAIHLSKSGVRTVSVSVPCRYIHSPSCMADLKDIENAILLTEYLTEKICCGEVK
ncbi:MAG: M42 family metallopeptidase [Acutalibacteraceae bacterium]|nr:M42 family metallopeptidase [Acutalibacteraceae bacterium]